MNKGKLYLIPTPLGENDPAEVLPKSVIDKACSLRIFVVEETRTARRFLSRYGLKGHIAELEFHELNEHSTAADIEALGGLFDRGEDVGLLSEAGLPAVADPGADLVALCHRRGIEVVPLVGPSSLMLALMASGLNGQSFAFNGYLPVKPPERTRAIRFFERRALSEGQSQLFIEAPYRNVKLMEQLVQTLGDQTRLTVAVDLTAPDERIETHTAGEWRRRQLPEMNRRPAIFIIG